MWGADGTKKLLEKVNTTKTKKDEALREEDGPKQKQALINDEAVTNSCSDRARVRPELEEDNRFITHTYCISRLA